MRSSLSRYHTGTLMIIGLIFTIQIYIFRQWFYNTLTSPPHPPSKSLEHRLHPPINLSDIISMPKFSPRVPSRWTLTTFIPTASDFPAFREFIGHMHLWSTEPDIYVQLGPTCTVDHEAETALFERVHIGLSPYPTVVIPLQYHLSKRLCALNVSRIIHECTAPDPGLCPYLQPYFTVPAIASREGSCAASMRPHVAASDPLPAPSDDTNPCPFWCMLVATYNPGLKDPLQIPLLTQFLPAFLKSIAADTVHLRFALYIGTQVDPIWDDPWAKGVIQGRLRANELRGILIRIHRYPLNPGLLDITWKYNALAAQAYADGCTYVYQFSDDVAFETAGWAPALASFLDTYNGFGTTGVKDRMNEGTMTLGASGRVHMAIQGEFWPHRFKNWYSDDFIQWVYGPYSHRFDHYWFRNTQILGQRYHHCLHVRILHEEWTRARYRAWQWALKTVPNTTMVSTLETLWRSSVTRTASEPKLPWQLPDPACPLETPPTYDRVEDFI